MKNIKLTIILFSTILSTLMSEAFIDTNKELSGFYKYDFGTPIKQKIDSSAKEVRIIEENSSKKDLNISTNITKETSKQKLKRDFKIKCGGKCGISFKN